MKMLTSDSVAGKQNGKYDDVSFKFTVSAFGSTVTVQQQRDVINSFSYLGFNGPISMKNPDYRFCVMEDYGGGPPVIGVEPTRKWIYMGVMVKNKKEYIYIFKALRTMKGFLY